MFCMMVLTLCLFTVASDRVILERVFRHLFLAGNDSAPFSIRPLLFQDPVAIEDGVMTVRITSNKIRTFVVEAQNGERPSWHSTNESTIRICDCYTHSAIVYTGTAGQAYLVAEVDGLSVAIRIIVV